MCSFINTAGKRIGDKCLFEDWIEHAENGMVKYAISDNGFVNMPLFRIVQVKRGVRSVFIPTIFQIFMKLEDVFFKLPFESLHIPLFLLIALEFIPRRKQVF